MTVEIRVLVTRTRGFLCENWNCPNDYAREKLGYVPKKGWHVAVRKHLVEIKALWLPPGRCSITPAVT